MILSSFVLEADILITRPGPRSLSVSLHASGIRCSPHRNLSQCLSLMRSLDQLREETCSPPAFATIDCTHAIGLGSSRKEILCCDVRYA